jgi:hypothetical protein
MRPVPNECAEKLPGFAFLPRSFASAVKTAGEANAVSGGMDEESMSRTGVGRRVPGRTRSASVGARIQKILN